MVKTCLGSIIWLTRRGEVEASRAPEASWLTIERRGGLLAAGSSSYHGVSARKNVALPELRHKLLPFMEEGLEHNRPISITTALGSGMYASRRTLLSPLSRIAVAVIGTLHPTPVPPQEPLIGTWEWDVAKPGSGVQTSSWWDAGMFQVYGIPPEHPNRDGAYPAPPWMTNIVVAEDRLRLRQLIDLGVRSRTDQLHSIAFDAETGYGTEHRTRASLRLVGRAAETPQGTIRLTGLTHRIQAPIEDSTPGLKASRSDDYVRALFELVEDRFFCIVDADYWQAFLTSPGTTAPSLEQANSYDVLAALPVTEHERVTTYLREAAGTPHPRPAIEVNVIVNGKTRQAKLKASGVRDDGGNPTGRYVACVLRFRKPR
ncbi:hypothetical protein [Plantibacter sp. CFBP 13570]|uniref:hypothetical protein n=1 Tax=Plantibacter sp. CFBP 13570 TaxID=2775272 RepID=UPI0019309FB1|nr:hypothetical protein [Plantibacter sp. CFBP 13570]MBD8535665.1 hypothetical protein [Plantibacter sp. CFBP 13570]